MDENTAAAPTHDLALTREAKVWYALRATYRREMKVKDELDALGIECFLPMKYAFKVRLGRRVKTLVPVVHNLLFVHVEPSRMRVYKATARQPVCYIMNPGTRQPVVVPDAQMRNFIAVAGTHDEQLKYIEVDPGTLARGDRVRITGGLFEGAEGVLMRVRGKHRVVVSIEGLVAVATAELHPSLLQKLD